MAVPISCDLINLPLLTYLHSSFVPCPNPSKHSLITPKPHLPRIQVGWQLIHTLPSIPPGGSIIPISVAENLLQFSFLYWFFHQRITKISNFSFLNLSNYPSLQDKQGYTRCTSAEQARETGPWKISYQAACSHCSFLKSMEEEETKEQNPQKGQS